jgi:hypothetical protein
VPLAVAAAAITAIAIVLGQLGGAGPSAPPLAPVPKRSAPLSAQLGYLAEAISRSRR